jgi:hypothetical protein
MQDFLHLSVFSELASALSHDIIYLGLAFLGWLTISIVLRFSVRLSGKPPKTVDENRKASVDIRLGLAEEDASALAGFALLEHYGALGAPCGIWSGDSDIAVEVAEPTMDEVSDFFHAAFSDEALASCHQAVEKQGSDARDLSLLTSCDVFSGSLGGCSGHASVGEAEPSLDVCAGLQESPLVTSLDNPTLDESLQLLLDEASGAFGAPLGSWRRDHVLTDPEAGLDDTSAITSSCSSWTSLDEPFLNEALQLLVKASSSCLAATKSGLGRSADIVHLLEQYGVLGAPTGSWQGYSFASQAEPNADEVSAYFQAALA